MANQKLIQELQSARFAGTPGYWLSRGHKEFPGWDKLPFSDFFENLSSVQGNGHKKMWLNPDGTFKTGRLSNSSESLMPLYDGIQKTLQKVVSASFFMYSALIVQLHMDLAYFSKELNCEPDINSVLDVASTNVKEHLTSSALALRVTAFILYEGDGLGGYNPNSWKFWGRLTGTACPTDPDVLDLAEAKEAAKTYRKASVEEQQELFYQWFEEVHPGYPFQVVSRIYEAYELARRYKAMEAPDCSEDKAFNPKDEFDVRAALCGFFRRSAVGELEAKAYNPNEETPHRTCEMLSAVHEQMVGIFQGKDGITLFGQYILDILDLHLQRLALVVDILERGEQAENDQAFANDCLSQGFKLAVSKRGRRRS